MKAGKGSFIALFFLFNLLISSYYLDVWRNANTTSRALPVVTFFEEGTFRIDRYHELTVDKAYVGGHYYTDKAPLPTYLMIPVFGLLNWLGIIAPDDGGSLFGDHIYLLGAFFTASLPFALMLTFLFREIRRNSKGISPVLLATMPFYASFLFVFTGTYFAHLLSGVLLLGTYLFLRKRRFLVAGLAGGLAFLSEYNLALILLLWGLLIPLREKRLEPFVRYSLGILPSLLFIVYYNSVFSSSPFTFMYKHHNFSELDTHYGFVLPGLEPFWGLTFSPYRGIFFFAPFLLVGLYILVRKLRTGQWPALLQSYLVIPFALYFLFIASYFAWWGGWTYGPRLLLGLILILLYRLSEYMSAHPVPRPVFLALASAGLVLTLPAKGTIAYSAPTGVMNPFLELVVQGMRTGVYNPNNILTLWAGVPPGSAFAVFLLLFAAGFTLLTLLYKNWEVR